jgi:hypothetical protein
MMQQLSTTLKSGQSGLVLTSFEPEIWFDDLNAQAATPAESAKKVIWYWDGVDGLTRNGQRLRSLLDDTDLASVDAKIQPRPLLPTLESFIALCDFRNQVFSARYQQSVEMQAASLLGEPSLDVEDPLGGRHGLLCIRQFDRFLSPGGSVDPMVLAYVLRALYLGSSAQMAIVMQVTPGFEMPPELLEHTQIIEHALPDEELRLQLLSGMVEAAARSNPDKNLQVVVDPLVLSATAGLSAGKMSQFASESLITHQRLDPLHIFQAKAQHLSRASKLDVWSPLFDVRCRLWPDPVQLENHELEALCHVSELTLLQENTAATDPHLREGEVRAQVTYMQNDQRQTVWLDPLPSQDFDRLFRPERNFYSLDSIVGLSGLKAFLRNGLRPGVPERAKMRHVLMLGVPGTGKSFTMKCCSGEFRLPLSSMKAGNLYSKWLGDTDKILDRMLATVDEIGGILAIDEFQRFLPTGNSEGGVESRMLGTLLTWFNEQKNTLVLSAANNISYLPDEITRSGRVDALVFVGFPGKESKQAAWQMYLKRHQLAPQETPRDEYWTPADIASCCRLAELQRVDLKTAARWITPSYEKNKEKMDELLQWAESAGCVCAESGERFTSKIVVKTTKGVTPNARQVKLN